MMVSSSMLGTSSSASLIFALRCFAVTSPSASAVGSSRATNSACSAARDVGIAVQRGGDEILALRDAGLLQVAAIGAQDADLADRRPAVWASAL